MPELRTSLKRGTPHSYPQQPQAADNGCFTANPGQKKDNNCCERSRIRVKLECIVLYFGPAHCAWQYDQELFFANQKETKMYLVMVLHVKVILCSQLLCIIRSSIYAHCNCKLMHDVQSYSQGNQEPHELLIVTLADICGEDGSYQEMGMCSLFR